MLPTRVIANPTTFSSIKNNKNAGFLFITEILHLKRDEMKIFADDFTFTL